MTHADESDFMALITDVLGFYNHAVSPFAIGVWWQACEPFSLEQVRLALSAHALDAERGQFAPRPADIVKALAGTQTDRSLVAWGKVNAAMQRVGAYESVAFDDPAIHVAIEDIGGWVAICRSDVDELPHLQRRFCASYRAASAMPSSYPPRLIGDHEAANRLQGRRVAPPVYIGDPDRAREVELLGGAEPRLQITTGAQVIPLQAALANSVGRLAGGDAA